ncbi:salicylate hydroxylase [Aspergillus ibericus CBS 121593]|uniref:Salicylate hydroxylase n=1 Tax=Aspergillus ibericus CBS 121593 TaxID=1448316 RepID=A0A395H3M6_9EURO|nr:salicylate hydroxylase [Aspergillus ibericus CBS 121593]RAL01458.1 salicylate hydroxylase [Aspergillus ibericus CBS 121593]
MDTYQDTLTLPRAKTPLNVLVMGAGIAGLTVALALHQAGHKATILERVHGIAEVGAGIQMAPNAARILGRLGLLEEVMSKANTMEINSLRRYENNEELGQAPLMPGVGERYHAPLAVIHRGDLQRILLDAFRNQNITIRTNARVSHTGEWVEGDVVIGADGIKSDLRHQMAAHHGIPKEKRNVGMRWMGLGGHIMAYPIKNNSVYNMVLLHPQKEGAATEESWTNPGDKREMEEFYAQWNGLVRSLLSYVPDGEVMEWTLNSHFPLPTWIENRVVLMGDACHPMLPYVAQGAAQAIEDAGVLACALSLTEDLDGALAVYERVRKDRAEKIQKSAAVTRKALHLPDGEEQRKRDEAIRGPGKNPDLWADHDWQDFMWGTDVMKETVGQFEDLLARSHGYHPHALNAVAY